MPGTSEVAAMVLAERVPEMIAGHEAIAAGKRPDFLLRSEPLQGLGG